MSYYSDQVIRDGAVSYWRLGETSGNQARDSVGTAHGTISGGVTLGQNGALVDSDKAMLFDGNTGHITVPNGVYQAVGTGPLTVECWCKTSVLTTTSNEFLLDNHNGSAAKGFDFNFYPAPDRFFWKIGDGVTLFEVAGPVVTNSMWHHVVGVVTRGTPDRVLIYLDGVVVADQASTISGADLTPTTQLRIGSYQGDGASSDRHFDGAVDEVAIYKTALTASQIATHYNLARLEQFPTGSYPDRVIRDGATAYWRLGETSGTTAVDIIGGANGTISGGVTLGQSGVLADGNKAMGFPGTTTWIDSSPVNIPSAFTLEIWIYPTQTRDHNVIANRTDDINGAWSLELSSLSTAYLFILGPNAGSATTSAATGRWSHIVFTHDGTMSRAYLDGVLQNSTAIAHQALAAGRPIRIGGNQINNTYFVGYLDEVAIYPTALTTQQIANHYGLGKLASPFGKLIPAGVVTSLNQSEIYALSPKISHVTSSSTIEVSPDGVTFTPLTDADTVGARTQSMFVRTLNPTCALIGK